MESIFKNKAGELYKDRINLTVVNKKQTIQLKNITNIKFIKTRKLQLNYFISITVLYLYYSFDINSSHLSILLINILTLAVLILTNLYIKLFNYKLIIIKKNDFMTIQVSRKLKIDAEKMVFTLNRFVISSDEIS